jgi:hypothetical protein
MVIGKSRVGAIACAALLGGLVFAAPPAQAWWRGGVWIGVPPVVIAPPVYAPYYYPPAYYPYYPPAYYPPAPAYAPPAGAPQSTPVPQADSNSGGQVAYGATCYAGVYVCQAPGNTPVNASCSCPGLGAPSYGVVR